MNNGKSTSFDAMHIHLKNFGDYRILKMGSKQIWLCLKGDKRKKIIVPQLNTNKSINYYSITYVIYSAMWINKLNTLCIIFPFSKTYCKKKDHNQIAVFSMSILFINIQRSELKICWYRSLFEELVKPIYYH